MRWRPFISRFCAQRLGVGCTIEIASLMAEVSNSGDIRFEVIPFAPFLLIVFLTKTRFVSKVNRLLHAYSIVGPWMGVSDEMFMTLAPILMILEIDLKRIR